MQQAKSQNLISPAAAEKLISAHDGDAALLYLFLAHEGGELEQAAGKLCRTLRQMEDAEEKLRRMGLLPISGAARSERAAPAPALDEPEELPQYTAEEISRRSAKDAGFTLVLDEAAKVMGKKLSGADMRVLFGIYDYLGMPVEVMVELLYYCGEICESRRGSADDSKPRRPSARFIEKEAYAWVNREIMTLEQAEEYIRSKRQRRSLVGSAKAALGISGRELSASEEKLISSWLDMGFDDSVIALAYDRTVLNTGGLKWPYMNKILQSWQGKDLHTVEDIEREDPPRKGQAKPAKTGGDKPIDIDRLRSLVDKI